MKLKFKFLSCLMTVSTLTTIIPLANAADVCGDNIDISEHPRLSEPEISVTSIKDTISSAIETNDVNRLGQVLKVKKDRNLNIDLNQQVRLAFQKGYQGIIDLLIENGASISLALHEAAERGNTSGIIGLLEKKAKFNIGSQDEGTETTEEIARKMAEEKKAEINAAKKINGDTPLHSAAIWGALESVQYLVKNGADVNAKNNGGATPLHCAAIRGNFQIAKFLLENDANFDEKDNLGFTPIQYAIKLEKTPALVNCLLERGANIDDPTLYLEHFHYFTSLSLAAQDGHFGIIKFLLENDENTDINSQGIMSPAPLNGAVRQGDLRIVRYLVEHGADINVLDKCGGLTPLQWAARKGHLEIVKYLVERGADINVVTGFHGFSPLQWAVREGHLEIVKYLIERGAKIDVRDKTYNSTALHNAALIGNLEIVKYLVERGAAIDVSTYCHETPISLAAGAGHTKVVNFLEAAKLKKHDMRANTSIYEAARDGNLDVVKHLLAQQPTLVNIKDESDATPLHWAACYGYEDVVKYLLSNGAEINAQDHNGRTPLHLATLHNKSRVIEYLINRNAQLDVRDKTGKMPLEYLQ